MCMKRIPLCFGLNLVFFILRAYHMDSKRFEMTKKNPKQTNKQKKWDYLLLELVKQKCKEADPKRAENKSM